MQRWLGRSALIAVLAGSLVPAGPLLASGRQEPRRAGVPIAQIAPVKVSPSGHGPRVSRAFGGADASPIVMRSVIGGDGRTQVTDTTVYPARAIGQIELTQNGDMFICTGWLIDANTILASGHCAFNPSPGGGDSIETATFSAGRNGGTDPYGTCNVLSVYAPKAWRVNGKSAHDWSLMQLDCAVGDTVGWLGYFFKEGVTSLEGTPAVAEGYPGDKSFGTQWVMDGSIKASTAQMVFYKMDTFGGQSGSPIFQPNRPSCGGPCAMAVHSYGVGGTGPGAKNNSGPRITAKRFDLISELAAQND